MEKDQINTLIDRWFGDHAIPNHFRAAAEDLKTRLLAAASGPAAPAQHAPEEHA